MRNASSSDSSFPGFHRFGVSTNRLVGLAQSGGAGGRGEWYDLSLSLLEFANVTVVRNDRTVLDNLSLTIHEGEHVAILGPNGSGKSSLIKTINREFYPLQRPGAAVRILGKDVWNVFDLRVMLGIVNNDLLAANARDVKGREAVLSGFFSSIGVWPGQHTVTPEMERKTDEVMERLEITHLADRWVDELSSGEARRVVIARALVHDPKALLFDEPTASLDLHAMYELGGVLRKLAQSGISILLVTHHLPDLIPEIGRVVMIRDGRIWKDGSKEDVLTEGNLSELFRVPVQLMRRDGYYHVW